MSLLDIWNLPLDACIGRDVVELLKQHGFLHRETDEDNLVQSVHQAAGTKAILTTHIINAKPGYFWAAQITPVFKGDELLAFVLVWKPVASGPATEELRRGGLSTDEAFRILVGSVQDYAIFLLDSCGYVATWNVGAELNKGYKREEIVGKHFSIFYGEDDIKNRKPEIELEVCLREGRVEDEGWRYRKDGSRFWANVIITAIYKDGVHVGFGKVTRNLTERKAAELRIIAAYEESAKLKSEFLANMSHEIRTPMHGMLSACSLLLDTPLTPEQRDTAKIIGESGQVLLQVINDILDYSKLTSGNFSISADVVSVASIITSVVRSVQTTLRPSVHLELNLDPNLPASVQGDPLRYRQVFQNIVGNAAKFTEKGIISVRATMTEETDSSCVIQSEITDTGVGIAEELAANLFNPFTQLNETAKKRYQGTGLGLSISKSLVELMGGHIGYRPNPDCRGSIFWFTTKFNKIKTIDKVQGPKDQLPIRDKPQPSDPAVLADDPVVRLKSIAPEKRLLVVEDNLINQRVLTKTLHSFGFSSLALASDGEQAMEMVLKDPSAFDLVLMDVMMPKMDGHEATIRIRQAGVRIPIVAMTAHALKGHIELCLETGMDDYIPKPMERKRVVMTLLRWLSDTGYPGYKPTPTIPATDISTSEFVGDPPV